MDNFICSMCNFTTDIENQLVYHIIRKHCHEKNFQVNCTAPSYYYSSKSWAGFRSHYSRKHRKSIDKSYEDETRENDNFLNDCSVSTSSFDVNMQCASFAMRLMSKHKLPETSVNDIIESTINFLVFSEEISTQNLPLKILEALEGFKTRKT